MDEGLLFDPQVLRLIFCGALLIMGAVGLIRLAGVIAEWWGDKGE